MHRHFQSEFFIRGIRCRVVILRLVVFPLHPLHHKQLGSQLQLGTQRSHLLMQLVKKFQCMGQGSSRPCDDCSVDCIFSGSPTSWGRSFGQAGKLTFRNIRADSLTGYLSVLTCVGLCIQGPAAGWGQAYGRQNTLRTERPIPRRVRNKEFMRKA